MNVTLKDFQLINNWKPYNEGPTWGGSGIDRDEPVYIIDQSTNRKYFNESPNIVRFKCFLLTLGTPVVHGIVAVVSIAVKIIKLITFSHFWLPMVHELNYNFKARLTLAGKDLLKIITTPLTIVGLQLASLYGWVRPYDGRKLYATLERTQYGSFILAPCFQPEPCFHAFGGNINTRNAF